MRVAFISSGLDPRTGGTATAATAVAVAAARAGIDVTLAFPGALPEAAAAILTQARVATVSLPFSSIGGRLAQRWGVSWAMGRWLRRHVRDFDAVVVHSPWVLTSVMAVAAAKRAGIPVAMMPHEGLTRFDMGGSSAPGLAGRVLRAVKAWLRDWYLARLDRVIASSDLERLDSDLRDAARDVVIAHPAFDERDPPTLTAPRAVVDGQVTVGLLGRFHPKKNLERLIEALSYAPHARLIVGGDGDPAYRDALHALAAKRGVADRIDWRGFLSDAGKAQFFAEIDVLAVPSRFECFGLVAVEALGRGVPVIASPTVGVADAIVADGCGIVVPPRGDALGVAIAKAGEPGVVAGWAANARSSADQRYSYAAHGLALKAALEDML